MIETFTLPIGRMIVKLGGSLILKISYSYKKKHVLYVHITLITGCGCNPIGSVSTQCNRTTGICTCKDNVIGEKCDMCAPRTSGMLIEISLNHLFIIVKTDDGSQRNVFY